MLTLGIESSCDDTAAAVLDNDQVLSNVLSSQDAIHSQFGGIVPELASRQHLQSIHPIVQKALDKANVRLSDIGLVAATQGPGLIGSLLVGFSYAKALSHVRHIPFVGVDHMAGHILSIFLGPNKPDFPYIALIVSGGTSSIFLAEDSQHFQLLGRTRDDAAGEAFDKVAKLLQLGYPGGPVISRTAADGDPQHVQFPRAWLDENSLDFSFSGLKTAVLNYVTQKKLKNEKLNLADLCASFQEAVIDVLVGKTLLAAQQHKVNSIVVGGGVSSNLRLRDIFAKRCQREGIFFFAPPSQYCTDNGAMIAFAGTQKFAGSGESALDEDVYSRSLLA